MKSQKFFKFSCELFIEQYKVSHAGYLYFIWVCGNKQTQTLKYDTVSSNFTEIGQTLSLNLVLTMRNGKFLERPTNLFLLNQQGDQLDDIEINVADWTQNFKEINVPIGGGAIHAKVRRKQIMEVNGLQQSSSQNIQQVNVKATSGRTKIVQTHQQQLYLRTNQKSFYLGRNEKSFGSIQQHHSQSSLQIANEQLLEQLGRVKKQLQDNVYLNNKLKNDRDVLMKKQQSLENEIQSILNTVSMDIKNLREHTEKRISIRETIYQEQIQQMIVMVNGNSEYSKKVIEQILRQKNKMQEEHKFSSIQLQKVKKQLKQYKQKYQGDLHYLNSQLANKIEQHQRQKQQTQRRAQQQMKRKGQQVQKIKIQVLKQREDIQNQLQTYKVEFQKSRVNNMSLQDELMEQTKKNEQKSVEIHQKVMQIEKASMNIRTLSEMLQAEQRLIAQLKGDIQKMKSQSKQSNQDLINLNAQVIQKNQKINQLEAQLEQITYELQFNQSAHKQLKVQHQQKQQQLYNQLQNIEAIYNDKMEQYAKKLHQKLEQLSKQNNELRQRLGLSQKQLSEIQSQLQQKQSQMSVIRQSQRGTGQKDFEVKKLLTEKQQLRKQFQDKMRSMQIQLEKRDQQLSQRVKELEDQLHITRKKKDQSQIKIKHYQKQIENLKLNEGKGSIKSGSQNPAVINRSVQISRVHGVQNPYGQNMQGSRQQISLGPINHLEGEDFNEVLIKKEEQIHRLNNRIDQLNGWCNSLEQKLREVRSTKLVEYCQSQKNEQDHVNKDQIKKKVLLDDLDTLQKGKHKHQMGTNIHGTRIYMDNSNSKNDQSGQLILDEANFGYTPKNKSYLKRRQSMGMSKQLSEHSNTSYIRVSHNQKIKEQEDLIQQFQQREEGYKRQIQGYTKKIEEMNNQIQKVKKQMEEYMMKPQVNQSTLNQLETLRGLSQDQRQQIEAKSIAVSQLKQDISRLKPQLQHLRSLKPQMQQQLKQLTKSFNQTKQTLMQVQIKLKDADRRLQQSQQIHKKQNNQLQNLSKIINQLQQKIREGKEHEQQIRMQNRQLMFVNEQTTNQMKKYKSSCEDLQQKVKKYIGSDVTIRQLQKQIEDWNKKNLDQLRLYNNLKLQKDSLDEEIKLIKKRHGQQTRVAIQWEEKAHGLERVIDQYKRKQGKFKRQVEQAQQQCRKTRQNQKKIQEQLHTLQTLSTSFSYEKKKFMDQISQKGDELTRKQYENQRLLKELQKYRHRIQESQDNRLGRKNQLRFEIEKLQAELIKKDKRILEMEEQGKMLKSRLEFLQKENTKIMQKKTQTYGDKLKHYVDQIASIKKLLDEYQTENTKLKLQNNEFYQENQLLKLSLNKLQKKYEQNIDNEQTILNDLQHYMDEFNLVSDKNRQYEMQLDRIEQSYVQVKKQLDEQKIHHKKKTERLESAQKTNGILMEQVKDLKVKLSQLQTETKISYNINEKYRNLDRKKTEIEEQLKRVKQQYDSYRNVFVYKDDDLQKICQDIKNNQRKLKQAQLNSAIQELTKAHSMKSNKFESELLEMFNQNSRVRQELANKAEQLGKTKLQISELDSMTHKIMNLQNQLKQLNQQLNFQKQESKRRNDKISKDQVYIKQLQTKIQSKQVDLVDSINRVNDLQMKIEKLTNKIGVLQENEESLQDKIRELIQKQKQSAQQRVLQQQSQHTNPSSRQNIERRLFQTQLQLAKHKQKQNTLTLQYNTKIKSLQKKLQEMSDTMSQHQRQLQKHYQDELYKSEQSILKLSEQLEDKLIRIDQLNQAIIVLQHQNQQFRQQLQTTRFKLDQQTEIFNIEYGKLKEKLKQSEDVYNQNLKSLEDELTSMGKQLAIAKYNRGGDGTSGSRLKGSQIEDSKKVIKRMQEKQKLKDKKIEQLKSNIYILQETVLKLRKKQSSTESISTQYQNFKVQFNRLQQQLSITLKKLQSQKKTNHDLIRDLKQQLLTAKQNQQQSRIQLEQKLMEFTSTQCQLSTIKELYSQLQKQIDRRKVNLSNQMQQQSIVVIELRNKESIILEQSHKIQEINMKLESLITQNKKLTHQAKLLTTQIKQLSTKSDLSIKHAQQSQNSKILLKKQLQELRQKNFLLEAQTKSIRLQLQKLKRFNQQSKNQLSTAYEQLQKFTKGNDSMTGRLRQYEQMFTKLKRLEEISQKQIGCSLQQLIDEGYFVQTLEQKQNQINQLIEEVEQLKFLSDRKLLDYEEIKRENYELQLRSEDNEILAQQVQNLRRICDKLEQQKKQAVFKEQLIKMHLGNMIQNGDQDEQVKRKIEHVLRNVAAVGQIGIVSFGESSFGNF